ncbi:MAG: S9 family peptidase [Planctomycetes bacterium]|nr:S9 family peptidase [Planctomycetota bacterium]
MAAHFDIDRFLNIRSASGASFSPDGRFVAFLTNVTGVSQLWQVPIEGGWPVQLTFTRDSVRGGHYSPTRHELIFSMDAGGNERTQLYLLKGVGRSDHGLGDGWTIEDLSGHPKAIHSFGGWSRDGSQFAFAANRDRAGRFDIYVQKLGDEARLVAKGPGGFYSPVGWSPDDGHLLVYRIESNTNQDLYVIDLASGKVQYLTEHQGEAQYHSPAWSADGKSIYCVSTVTGRDRAGLAQIDVANGKGRYLETPEAEVESVAASPKGRWLAWLVNAGGKSELKLRDLKTKETLTPPGLPLGVVSHLEFARDDSKLAFVFDGPRHNPDVWLWDLKGNKLRQLTHSSRAGIPFAQFVEPELIYYETFDKRKIPAWFYKPADRSPLAPREEGSSRGARGLRLPPVIVYPHGGPEGQTRPAFNALFQYFAQAGYAILAPNVRGSTGYGTTYMNLDNTTKRMDAVNDLAHAAYWLRDKQKGDPKRLAVYGGSYGGFMVLASVTHYPDLWAAGIDVVGIANFITFLENTGAYRRAHRAAEYGNLEEHRDFLKKISPIHQVDKIRCPMMVIHGANDPRVPIGEAEQIVAALRKRNVPVEYLRYEDEGHGLVKLKNRLDAYPKMIAFLNRHLK